MNNYCRNCGQKIEGKKVCPYCNTVVLTERKGEANKELEIKLFVIFLILSILFLITIIALVYVNPSSIIFDILLYMSPAIITIYVIYAKVKLKYSIIFNIIFWLLLTGIVIALMISTAITMACTSIL